MAVPLGPDPPDLSPPQGIPPFFREYVGSGFNSTVGIESLGHEDP
jgi:hypothetical protein